MAETFGVVSNPHSRRNRAEPDLTGRISRRLASVAHHRMPDTLDGIPSAITALEDEGVDVIAINGGDGTVHHVISALIRHWSGPTLPKVALLPGGTNNTIARGLGIRGRPEPILARYLGLNAHETTTRRTLAIDGRHGFLFSNGLFARYLELYDAGPPSMARAAWVLAKAVFSALVGGALARHLTAPMHVEVEVDGVIWPSLPWMTLPAGTVDDIGLGFRAFPRAPSCPDGFEILGIACSAFQLAFQLPRFYAGRGPSRPDIRAEVCREVVLRAHEPFLCALDGDPFTAGPELRIRSGPLVTFILPRERAL